MYLQTKLFQFDKIKFVFINYTKSYQINYSITYMYFKIIVHKTEIKFIHAFILYLKNSEQ